MTNQCQVTTEELLGRAQAGSTESLGHLLQLYANYLKLLVLAQLEQNLRARVSPSDVVQETFFEAHRDFVQFRGTTSGEFLAWLRTILVNNLCRVVEQHVLAEKRDVRREVSMERLASAAGTIDGPAGSGAARSRVVAQRRRSSGAKCEIVLADQLAELPADYRDVIVLRHIEGVAVRGSRPPHGALQRRRAHAVAAGRQSRCASDWNRAAIQMIVTSKIR